MRMVVIAGLLMLALLGAVLGSIGATGPAWESARDNGGAGSAPAGRDAMRGPLAPG
jgi:hypothetical protein